MKNIFFCLILLISSLTLSAQQFTWAQRGGGSNNFDPNTSTRYEKFEHIRDIVIDSQNNYYFLAKVGSGNTNLNNVPFTNYNQPGFQADTFLFSTDCDGAIRWQKVIGGWNEELTQHLSIDSNDNIYVSGLVLPRGSSNEGFIHFDTDLVINSNLVITDPGPHNKSLYLIKYDSSGNFQWLQRPQTDNAAFQEFQKSYTFGHYTDSNDVTHWLMTMGAGTHINGTYTASNDDYAVFRFDDQGNYLGNTPVNLVYTGGRLTYAANLAMDENLNRYIISTARAFNTTNTIDFLGSPVSNNVVLASIDATTGNLLWRIENTSTLNGTNIYNIKIDNNSNIYVSGKNFTGGNGMFDSFAGYTFTTTSASGNAATTGPFIIKLDANGSLLWGSNPSRGSQSGAYKMAFNNNEVSLVTGLSVTQNWGNFTYNHSGGVEEAVIVSLDQTTGNVLSIKDIRGTTQGDEATAIATDNLGNYVVGGFMRNNLFLNSTGITPLVKNGAGETDFWYARLATTDCNGVPLSNDEVDSVSFSIYPNPATDFIKISGTEQLENISYKMYSITGQLVKNGMYDSDSISIQTLNSGLYLLQLYLENELVYTSKIVKG